MMIEIVFKKVFGSSGSAGPGRLSQTRNERVRDRFVVRHVTIDRIPIDLIRFVRLKLLMPRQNQFLFDKISVLCVSVRFDRFVREEEEEEEEEEGRRGRKEDDEL
jgi:hypothetical protein